MSSPYPSTTKPLTAHDPNTSSPTKAKDIKAGFEKPLEKEATSKPQSMEYHRQVLQSKLDDEKSKQKYISPSDTIMSPCTAKLNAYKGKQFMKGKPQSLFGKMEASRKATAAAAADTPGAEGGKEREVGGS